MSESNKPQHHLSNGRFQNPPGSPPEIAHINDFVRFAFRQLWHRRHPIQIPHNHQLPIQQAKQMLHQMFRQDCITWLGHASFLMRLHQKTLLLDPFLSPCAGPKGRLGPRRFAPPGLPLSALPQIDILLLTHDHFDHLDLPTLKALPNKAKIQVVTPLKLGQLLQPLGFPNIYELDWYEHIELHPLRITALPAIHFGRRGLLDKNTRLWASFSIQSPQLHLYLSGDTAYGKVFQEIAAHMQPFDLALVGIGAYAPRRIMRPFHAAPEEAIQIALDLRAERILGMHWGTIVLSEEPPFEPPERFKIAGANAGIPDDKLWIMQIGETRSLHFQ